MSAIKLDQLDAQLARALAPVYVVHGDEPLLSLEAADTIRAKARAAGYTQRDVMQEIRARLKKFKELRISVRNAPSFNIGGGNTIESTLRFTALGERVILWPLSIETELRRMAPNSNWLSDASKAGSSASKSSSKMASRTTWAQYIRGSR